MTILHNLRAFHIRAQALKKKHGSLKEAWEQTESEFEQLEGKKRYKNFMSFRQVHWQVLTGNYRHLNK